MVDIVLGGDTATSVCLTENNFKDKNGNTNEEKSKNIRNEELKTVIVENDRGESKQVSETDGTTHSTKNEFRPRVEIITAVIVRLCVGG